MRKWGKKALAEFKNITKAYGGQVVFEDFSLSVPDGKHLTVMGRSGSGKTTLLRIAAGLTMPDSGEFTHSGNVAVMFQEPRLLPWKTARDNICSVIGKGSASLADKYLSAVGLADFAEKYPHELSGGMAQRVSFARFLAYAEDIRADLLLLDEPFSALDGDTAAKMIELLKDFSCGKTLILVSHDESDALLLGGDIIRI